MLRLRGSAPPGDSILEQLDLSGCHVSVRIGKLHFQGGGLVGDLLDLFERLVAKALDGGLDAAVCGVLGNFTSGLTSGLEEVHMELLEYANPFMVPPAIIPAGDMNSSIQVSPASDCRRGPSRLDCC